MSDTSIDFRYGFDFENLLLVAENMQSFNLTEFYTWGNENLSMVDLDEETFEEWVETARNIVIPELKNDGEEIEWNHAIRTQRKLKEIIERYTCLYFTRLRVSEDFMFSDDEYNLYCSKYDYTIRPLKGGEILVTIGKEPFLFPCDSPKTAIQIDSLLKQNQKARD